MVGPSASPMQEAERERQLRQRVLLGVERDTSDLSCVQQKSTEPLLDPGVERHLQLGLQRRARAPSPRLLQIGLPALLGHD